MTSSLLVDWPQLDAYLKLTEAPGERLLVLFPPKKGGGGGMHFPITDGVIPKDEVETVLRKKPHHSLGIVVNPALAGTYNKLISAGPAVADRLLSIALDPTVKSYAAVSACEAVIRSIERGVLDREMREHITKLREQMAQLEQGHPIDVGLP